MTELIKLLCGYLKNGTDDQKQMAEEMMLFIAKEKQAVLEPEYFIKYKLGMKMTNPKYDIIEKDGCDLYDEQTVFTGEDILRCPHGLYEVHWDGVGGRAGVSLASIGSLYSGARWISPTNWTSDDNLAKPSGVLKTHLYGIKKLVLIRKA